MLPPRSVLISVADPNAAASYVHLGARIAERHGSVLVLLNVEADGKASPVLDQARAPAASYDVPVQTITRAAPSVVEAIIRESQNPNIGYLIMGWRGDLSGKETRIGDNIDEVVKESDAHTIVMQRGVLGNDERLLVPVANPCAAPLALAVAALLRAKEGIKITVLHFSPVPLGEQEREHFRSALFDFAEETERGPESLFTDASQFELVFEEQDDPTQELAARSSEYDRMVLGTSREGYAGGTVFKELQLHIAERAQCPVVFIRPREAGPRFNF